MHRPGKPGAQLVSWHPCGAYGRGAQWVRWVCGLLGLVAAGLTPAHATAPSPVIEALNAEARLLHRRIDLSTVMRWDRRGQSWQPLARPTERLLVINLWSAHCKPCVDEFPLLRRLAAAWRSERDVRFLFISDPPHDTEIGELIAFWQQHAAAVPDSDPCRTTTDKLRAALDNNSQPLTLLVDHEGTVRQAFIGAIQERGLASAMERLIKILRAAPVGPKAL